MLSCVPKREQVNSRWVHLINKQIVRCNQRFMNMQHARFPKHLWMLCDKINNPLSGFNKSDNLPFSPFSFQVVNNMQES